MSTLQSSSAAATGCQNKTKNRTSFEDLLNRVHSSMEHKITWKTYAFTFLLKSGFSTPLSLSWIALEVCVGLVSPFWFPLLPSFRAVLLSLKKNPITAVIILIEKLLNSDWLKAVQLKGNTVQKSATPVQEVRYQCKLQSEILEYDWLKHHSEFSNPIMSCTMKMKILKTLKNFPQERKNSYKIAFTVLIRLQADLAYKPRPQTSHAKN